MSTQNDVFSFDLEESLFFEKGQEVSEMIGISLDPEISIQAFNEYISIRGVIELYGEYHKVIHDDPEDESVSLDYEDYHSRRYLERIEDTVDGRAEFTHRFPVEISVPSYRVSDVNEVTVSVDSFDYELPSDHQLKLNSTIFIHGISNQAMVPREVQEEMDQHTEEDASLEMEDESFEFEIDQDDLAAPADSLEKTKSVEGEESTEEVARWKTKKTQSFEEFFKDKSTLDDTVDADTSHSNLAEEEAEQEELDTEEISEKSVETESSSEDVNYLASMFRTDDQEEESTQMRICIVQEKDTLETIAERYEIPKLQLLKQNRLEDDDLLEGQLLSIPTKRK